MVAIFNNHGPRQHPPKETVRRTKRAGTWKYPNRATPEIDAKIAKLWPTTSAREIAEKLGISAGLVYHRVRDKKLPPKGNPRGMNGRKAAKE